MNGSDAEFTLDIALYELSSYVYEGSEYSFWITLFMF